MDDFVSFELSKKLKLSGFRDGCIATYNCSGELFYNKYDLMYSADVPFVHSRNSLKFSGRWDAPTISQVLKWLRKEKSLHIEIVSSAYGYIYIVSDTPNKGGTDRVNIPYKGKNDGGAWDDYEECVLDAIEYVIDNLL